MPFKERTGGGVFGGEGTQKGDVLEGVLADIIDGQYGDDYMVLTKDKHQIRVFGSSMLWSRITEKDCGKEIKLVYDGMGKTKKGRKLKMFRVFVNENAPRRKR